MSKNNVVTFRLNDEECQMLTGLVFISGLTQTDYIKSKIFPDQENEEERHEIKELLFKIKEQNDMIQKIILSSPNNNENVGIIKLIRKLLKQEFVTYALLVQIALKIAMKQEELYKYIDDAKTKAEEKFGKD